MFLVYAVHYNPDSDGDADTDSPSEEALVFCQDEKDVERLSKEIEGDLTEESDNIKVFNLSNESEREEAMGFISSQDAFVRS